MMHRLSKLTDQSSKPKQLNVLDVNPQPNLPAQSASSTLKRMASKNTEINYKNRLEILQKKLYLQSQASNDLVH
jgi:hypothetical protein